MLPAGEILPVVFCKKKKSSKLFTALLRIHRYKLMNQQNSERNRVVGNAWGLEAHTKDN
jgi:hypothetical protein